MARSFSETMSELRKARGLSQRTAAADLHISQALLSHYEKPGTTTFRVIFSSAAATAPTVRSIATASIRLRMRFM